MYINGLLEILNECTGVFVLDERAGFRPAGLARFARSKGGHLCDDPKEGKLATVALIERLVTDAGFKVARRRQDYTILASSAPRPAGSAAA